MSDSSPTKHMPIKAESGKHFTTLEKHMQALSTTPLLTIKNPTLMDRLDGSLMHNHHTATQTGEGARDAHPETG